MKRVLALLPVVLAFQVGVSPALAWTWPVDGPVLRPFSFNPDDPYAGGQHRGIDIGAPTGTPVAAPAGGTVSFAGTVPGGGLTLAIRTADGYSVTLVHLGAIHVARGATLAEGAVVGSVGPSGEPEHPEPYVQLGVRIAADPQGYVDPLSLLPPRSGPAPPAADAADEAPAPPADAAAEEAPVAGESATGPRGVTDAGAVPPRRVRARLRRPSRCSAPASSGSGCGESASRAHRVGPQSSRGRTGAALLHASAPQSAPCTWALSPPWKPRARVRGRERPTGCSCWPPCCSLRRPRRSSR
jgi:hypothetical protein